ncbi:MAG: Ankyrin repeat protein [Myxococcaceae bacterium]|nr:Ankyrin repeat protein [Myxococcaceae bacterium]
MRPRPVIAALCFALSGPAFGAAPAPAPAPAPAALKCELAPSPASAARGDARSREAAHKGLTFLSKASQAWTKQNNCFGCHVQAVTLEALTVGKKHQYDIAPGDIEAMVKALKLGVTAGGRVTGVAFEGSAWAKYDQLVSEREMDQLLKYAKELTGMQAQDGSIPDDDARLPVTGGTMQTTFQAAQTWRQAFARTADEKWLPPLRKAEAFLSSQSAKWSTTGTKVYLQDVNFALLGLVSSGVSRNEAASLRLQRMLLERQNADGGWGLDKQKSDAFATGQTVYALKMAGYSDDDAAVSKGMKYLIAAQDKSGAWRTYNSGQGGAEKAESMWAVLGLVTVDVASVAVKGLADGQHVAPKMPLKITAVDNQGGGIGRLEIKVDDLSVKVACGASLDHALDTEKLSKGKHVIEVIAQNGKGKESRRRYEVYAGDVFLTDVGAQFDERKQQTVVSLRNIAPDSEKDGAIELEVWSVSQTADAAPKAKVFSTSRKGEPGGLSFEWNGKGTDGKALPRGRYVAKLAFKDAAGKVRQNESALFFHDSEDAQARQFGQVEGQISTKGGGLSSNTEMELVDELGNVVQRTRTTDQGNYRFKNVNQGKYKVRAKKDGFGAAESTVDSAPNAAPAKASMAL